MHVEIDAIQAALDTNSYDRGERETLSTAYKAAGDIVLAAGYHWMAANNRRPSCAGGPTSGDPWQWIAALDGSWACSYLPRIEGGEEIWTKLEGGVEEGGRKSYPTRFAAEVALCRALATTTST